MGHWKVYKEGSYLDAARLSSHSLACDQNEKWQELHETWPHTPSLKVSRQSLYFPLILSLILNALLLALCLWIGYQTLSPLPPWPHTLYSPADASVEYEIVTFNTAFPGRKTPTTVYFGYNDYSNHAWSVLLQPYTSRISAQEAARLPRKTSKIGEDPEAYIMGLDVYHQLDCLNLWRKMIGANLTMASVAPPADEADADYHYHCVDSIRQSLMCNADLSVIHWGWNAEMGQHYPEPSTTHICRNWNRIHKWAVKHQLDQEAFNLDKFLE
ncbi:hypothetical protein BX600DRAFT_514423 [Xylariales sp. PMI_506]|nr:hypothetical protein BX600DRAFT_514423 [Xylariales sp. PMI_506]